MALPVLLLLVVAVMGPSTTTAQSIPTTTTESTSTQDEDSSTMDPTSIMTTVVMTMIPTTTMTTTANATMPPNTTMATATMTMTPTLTSTPAMTTTPTTANATTTPMTATHNMTTTGPTATINSTATATSTTSPSNSTTTILPSNGTATLTPSMTSTVVPTSTSSMTVTPSTPAPTMTLGYVLDVRATIPGDYDENEEEAICNTFSSEILTELRDMFTEIPMAGPCSTSPGSTIVRLAVQYISEPPGLSVDVIVDIITQLNNQGRFVAADGMVYMIDVASIVVDLPDDDDDDDDDDNDDDVILNPIIISAASFAGLLLIVIVVISICYCCGCGRVPVNMRRYQRRSRYNHLNGWQIPPGMVLPAAVAQPGYFGGVYGNPFYTSTTPTMAYPGNQSGGGINWGNSVVHNQPYKITTEPKVIKVRPGTRLNIVVR